MPLEGTDRGLGRAVVGAGDGEAGPALLVELALEGHDRFAADARLDPDHERGPGRLADASGGLQPGLALERLDRRLGRRPEDAVDRHGRAALAEEALDGPHIGATIAEALVRVERGGGGAGPAHEQGRDECDEQQQGRAGSEGSHRWKASGPWRRAALRPRQRSAGERLELGQRSAGPRRVASR